MVNISETLKELSKLLDETFPEAIRRIPIYPDSADITFLAHGIPIPDSREKDHSDYLRKCNENGIHPYLFGEFEYSKERFVPTLIALMQTAIPRLSQITVNEVLNPGRINHLKFEAQLKDTFTKSGVDYTTILTHEGYIKPLMTLFKKR